MFKKGETRKPTGKGMASKARYLKIWWKLIGEIEFQVEALQG